MSDYKRLIIGLGKTGWSVARFFAKQGLSFRVLDTRACPLQAKDFKRLFPHTPFHTGSLNVDWLRESHELILSPGIDPDTITPHITPSQAIYSDLDLFEQAVNAPVIGVTGSNGKSTVTVLIEALLKGLGKKVKTGGNLGTPALDLLVDPAPDFYILELSSFQLSITKKLKTQLSLFLNLAPDHLERHQTLLKYRDAKQRIYQNCHIAIWNRDVPCTYPTYPVDQIIDFGSNKPLSDKGFGLTQVNNTTWLMQGKKLLLNAEHLKIQGEHNYLNALSALAALDALTDETLPLSALKNFQGLPHRVEKVGTVKNIKWINDSKATNSHATHAALSSLTKEDEKKVILIAGGVTKEKDNLNILYPLLKKYVKQFILIGQDALLLKASFKAIAAIHIAKTLDEAVQMASNYAVSGDTILFSPACSSQDMFTDYAQRGECFKELVRLTLNLDKPYDK